MLNLVDWKRGHAYVPPPQEQGEENIPKITGDLTNLQNVLAQCAEIIQVNVKRQTVMVVPYSDSMVTFGSGFTRAGCLANAKKHHWRELAMYVDKSDFCAWDAYYWIPVLLIRSLQVFLLAQVVGAAGLDLDSLEQKWVKLKGTTAFNASIKRVIDVLKICATPIVGEVEGVDSVAGIAISAAKCSAIFYAIKKVAEAEILQPLRNALKGATTGLYEVIKNLILIPIPIISHKLRVALRSQKLRINTPKAIQELKSKAEAFHASRVRPSVEQKRQSGSLAHKRTQSDQGPANAKRSEHQFFW